MHVNYLHNHPIFEAQKPMPNSCIGPTSSRLTSNKEKGPRNTKHMKIKKTVKHQVLTSTVLPQSINQNFSPFLQQKVTANLPPFPPLKNPTNKKLHTQHTLILVFKFLII